MPFVLKTLSQDALPRALEKADRYRLLNEPLQAQSICLDILAADPGNQLALVTLLLAMTDQFGHRQLVSELEPAGIIEQLKSPYERAYYAGIVAERRGEAVLDERSADSRLAHDYLTLAMQHYEQAAPLRPPGNDDALLRWNTCARLLESKNVRSRSLDTEEPFLE
jgi:hypothetical protein